MAGVTVKHVWVVIPFIINQSNGSFTFRVHFFGVVPTGHRVASAFTFFGTLHLQVTFHAPAHSAEIFIYLLDYIHLPYITVAGQTTLVTSGAKKC
jgi:hypothetical protein